jgi:hypothetical protein
MDFNGQPTRRLINQPGNRTMQKLLATALLSAFALAQGPVFAQEKKAEPAKSEAKKDEPAKADAQKAETKGAEAKKDQQKKPKKGGC